MATEPANQGKPWSEQEVASLKQLASENTPTRVIALKLERSEASVESKAQSEGISLAPPNQSPYGTR